VSTLRIGVAGAGRVFERLYLPALAARRDIAVVGVAEPRLERFADVPPTAARARSVEELLDGVELDGLIVLTPPSRHVPDASLAMARGIPVLVEKPMATSPAEVETLRSAGGAGLLTPAFTRRYWPAYRAVAAAGPAWDVSIRLRSDPAGWDAVEGGATPLEDLAPHVLDLASFLTRSAIDLVLAEPHARGVAIDLTMANGAAARVVLDWPGEYREAMRVDGRTRHAGPPSLLASAGRRVLRRADPPVAAVGAMLGDWAARLRGETTAMLPAFEDGAAVVAAIEAVRARLGG